MKHVRRWLFRLAALLAVLSLLGCGWLFFDRWSGKREWENYRAAAVARGEKLTFREYLSPDVPPAENYTTNTIFERHRGGVQADGTYSRPLKLPDAPKGKTTNETSEDRLERALAGMRDAGWVKDTEDSTTPARAVLIGLEHFRTELSELRTARARPHSRFPQDEKLPPKTGFLSITLAMDVGRILALRMDAHLATGDPAEAWEDFLDGVRLYRAMTTEPAMICGLVRQALITTIRRAADEGIAARQWRDEDLAGIAAELEKIDIAADARWAFSSERGFINDSAEWLRSESLVTQIQRTEEMDFAGEEPRGWRLWLKVAAGKSWRDQLRENQILDLRLADLAAGFAQTFAATTLADVADEHDLQHLSDMTSTMAKRYVALEMSLRQTRVACALERFLMKRGTFPESLAELVPEFITAVPADVMDGQPVRYRRAEPGKFLLYSIGANGRDDAGSTAIAPQTRAASKPAIGSGVNFGSSK